jgi:hypothetical protein
MQFFRNRDKVFEAFEFHPVGPGATLSPDGLTAYNTYQ